MEPSKIGRSVRKPSGPKSRQPLKRKSCSPRNYNMSDDDDRRVYESRLHSDDSYTSDDSERSSTCGLTTTSPEHNASNRNKNASTECTLSPEKKRDGHNTFKEDPQKTSWFSCSLLFAVIFLLITVTVTAYNHTATPGPSVETLLPILKNRFNEQESYIWDDIYSGLNDVVEQEEALSIFILLSSESNTMNCLAQSLGEMSGRLLGTNDYLTLTPNNIGSDTGEVLTTFKEIILAKKVVVVQNLLDMNTKALEAFHNLCDRENPFIKQTVYIITILSENFERKRPQAFVEALISNKLSGFVDQDKIAPLVTRITDGSIIEVQPQHHMTKCFQNQ